MFLLFFLCLLSKSYISNKKGGQERPSLNPPVFAAIFRFSNQVPGLLHLRFKRPKVNINQHLVLAFEILWYSPRVPATGATSAILEFAGL
jgi:hypothetical protein